MAVPELNLEDGVASAAHGVHSGGPKCPIECPPQEEMDELLTGGHLEQLKTLKPWFSQQ